MYVTYLAGGIASGKSTVASELETLGAWRIDLDQVSRVVLGAGQPCLDEVAQLLGEDVIDPQTGEARRALIAERAFATPEMTARLEAVELPYIREVLVRALRGECCATTNPVCVVVEVPLLDRMESMLDLADEVLCVVCPLELRRRRAIGRGMTGEDFDRRVARQTSESYLRAHADTLFENGGTREELVCQVRDWWASREAAGWELGASGGWVGKHHGGGIPGVAR